MLPLCSCSAHSWLTASHSLQDSFRHELTSIPPEVKSSPSLVQVFLGHATSLCWKNGTVCFANPAVPKPDYPAEANGISEPGKYKSISGKGCQLGMRSPNWAAARLTLSLGRSAALCPVSQSRGEQQVRFEWRI